jgi:formylglycine-generating enzyme required for sulfatase activity
MNGLVQEGLLQYSFPARRSQQEARKEAAMHRLTPLLALVFLAFQSLRAAEPGQSYPLWDGKETVAEYAKRAGLAPTKTLDLGGGVKLEMVLIPAGKFLMGSPKTLIAENSTQHEVTITKPYYLGKYEVTQEQYARVMGKEPSQFKGRGLPVEIVSWDNAQVFCIKASAMTGLGLRLPTEAEWEYACRAGTKTRFYTGDTADDVDKAGWYDKNSNRTTHPVGQKVPNAWGAYDMHGNVCEWCGDWYEPYKAEAIVDPRGPAQGHERVMRGGSWGGSAWVCGSEYRSSNPPNRCNDNVGFRVVVEVPKKP